MTSIIVELQVVFNFGRYYRDCIIVFWKDYGLHIKFKGNQTEVSKTWHRKCCKSMGNFKYTSLASGVDNVQTDDVR